MYTDESIIHVARIKNIIQTRGVNKRVDMTHDAPATQYQRKSELTIMMKTATKGRAASRETGGIGKIKNSSNIEKSGEEAKDSPT